MTLWRYPSEDAATRIAHRFEIPRPGKTASMLRIRVVAVLALTAGSALFGSACAPGSSSTSESASPKEPASADGRRIVTEDFDDAKDWVLGDDMEIADGALTLVVERDKKADPEESEVLVSGAQADIELADMSVEADVSSEDIEGDDAMFGVVCRWTFDKEGNSKDWYSFMIAPNGYAAIGTSNDFIEQTHGVDVINRGPGVINRVRADCIGDTLTLFVNGTKVLSATDTALTRGDFGIGLENFAQRKATMQADDVRVIQVA